ncbi:hypothetical protein PoB_005678100 [Plakobranchus ocellatus]|uniref:Uncharacterized protein n=1 Tax=Plakobranchus ocellatus TaxID=259542 RepID=A0AAV4CC04_9GAST|nr:hypothetical protein PoB_005678100 [Plakobranchus ocellatus]
MGGAVAYLVGQLTTKSEVQGSNPSLGPVNFALLPRVHSAVNGVSGERSDKEKPASQDDTSNWNSNNRSAATRTAVTGSAVPE